MKIVILKVVLLTLLGAASAAAQSVPDALQRIADDAVAKGLPGDPLLNKIREGLAKNVDPARIEAVVRQMVVQLEAADRLIRESDPGLEASARAASVTLLAEAIGSGVTETDVRDLRRGAQTAGKPLPGDGLASAARSVGFIREAGLPAADGLAVVNEAVRQAFQSYELLDLGREVKRREADYKSGRSSLRALRDAIARGERPEQLFRVERAGRVERPAAARPEPPTRPERPTRPEVPVRPERPRR